MSRLLMKTLAVSAVLLASNAAQAAVFYEAVLSGANETTPTGSPGTGLGKLTIDDTLHSMTISITFADLVGVTTASHTHCCAPVGTNAGVATQVPYFTGFPIGVTSGSYLHTFDLLDLSTYNPAFVTAHGGTATTARDFLLAGLAADQAYLNIHTQTFPGGEIRGQWVAVPEPAAWALMIVGFGLVGARLRRRRPAFAAA